jgi:hypothetical protein
MQLRLYLNEIAKNAQYTRRSEQHDEYPKVELQRRPVVRSDVANHSPLVHDRAAA